MAHHCSVFSLSRLFSGAALLLLCMTLAACSSAQNPGASGFGRSSGQSPETTVPAGFGQGLPPVPLDIGSNARGASVVQSIVLTGSQTFQRSSAVLDTGTKATLTAAAGELQWAIYEFTPLTDQVYSALFTMTPQAGTGSWIGIANYGTLRWDFKGPYPQTPGFAAFASLNTGDYVSPSGHVYLLVASYNSTTTQVTQVQISADDGQAPKYDISGTVVRGDNNQPLGGVTLTMIPGGATVFTDDNGHYTFTDLSAASYKITPSAAGYDFNPGLQTVLLTNADVAGIDFIASEEIPGYSISGTISIDTGGFLAGATVTLNPTGLQATTDSQGNYLFNGLLANNYTLTPGLNGYTFAPTQKNVALFGSDSPANDFVATENSGPPYTVSGTVTDNNGAPMAGVNVFVPFTNRITTTNAQGQYSITNLAPDPDFHILASIDVYTFVPNISKFNLDSNKVVDFVGTQRSLPGTVTYAQHMVPWVLQPMCTPCHDSNLDTDTERHGAPLGIDFDTYDGTSTNEKKGSDDEAQADTMPDPDAWGSLTLTTFQKQLFARWREQNFPQ